MSASADADAEVLAMVRFIRFAASALVVVTLAALGCSSSSSSSGGGGGNPISSAGCQTCLTSSCSAQGAACTSSACQAFATCANSCTSQGCIQLCLQKNQDPAASSMVTCFNASCASCLTAPATGGSGSTSGGTGTCDTCLHQHCATQINACQADANCPGDVTGCTSSSPCTDTACLLGCGQQTGDSLAINYLSCVNTSCSTLCSSTSSSSGGSSGSGSGGTEPSGCLPSPPPAGTCPTGVAHDCPNGSPAGLTCTAAPSGTPGVPGPSGVYCCNG